MVVLSLGELVIVFVGGFADCRLTCKLMGSYFVTIVVIYFIMRLWVYLVKQSMKLVVVDSVLKLSHM